MNREIFPKASQTIMWNSYIYDIPESMPSKEEAEELMSNITKMVEKGGFRIKEWLTSGHSKTHQLDEDEDQPTVQLLSGVKTSISETEKVLEMLWNPKEDKLLYIVGVHFSKFQRLTSRSQITTAAFLLTLMKRQILSHLKLIYDPMGLISPFIVRAKIMPQKLWALNRNLGWDDPIPEGFRSEWLQVFQEFSRLQDISFDRSIKPDKTVGDPILVVFSDGSGEAYGAAAYARWRIPDQPYESRLIAAKNHIAPIKIVDIVRLELSGTVLVKQLKSFMQEELSYSFEKPYHIVDSEIVKAMISTESCFNTFSANRTGEVHQKTYPSEWFWVQSILNLADWITRGKSPIDLGS